MTRGHRDAGTAPSTRRGRGLVLLVALLLAPVHPVWPQDSPDLSAQIRAAFLFNFAKFTTWPASSTITFCVIGADPVGAPLAEAIRDRQIEGRPCRFARISTADEARRCQVLYAGGSENSPIVTAVRNLPVLTVGDGESFIDSAGLVAFMMDGSRMRFSINETLANQSGLKLSAKLLGLAKVVR